MYLNEVSFPMTFTIGMIKINSMSGNASFTIGNSRVTTPTYTDQSQGSNLSIGDLSKAQSQMENKQMVVYEQWKDKTKLEFNSHDDEEETPALTGIYP